MSITRVGFVGWRGMVGSVLINRMIEEGDFKKIKEPVFLVHRNPAKKVLILEKVKIFYKMLSILKLLKKMDVILTCQGSDYTKKIFKDLRNNGWKGFLD